jgi:hypothetical protein
MHSKNRDVSRNELKLSKIISTRNTRKLFRVSARGNGPALKRRAPSLSNAFVLEVDASLTASSSSQFEVLRRSPLERILSICSDVREGEGLGTLLLTADLTVLLGGYYLLKTVRESLILAQGGAEVKAYSSAAQPSGLALATPTMAIRFAEPRRGRWIIPAGSPGMWYSPHG